MVRQGIELVKMGVLSPGDLARKLSSNTARMLGLIHKGHLSVGADADISVLDPVKGRAYMGIAAGKIIMIDGTVVGRGGDYQQLPGTGSGRAHGLGMLPPEAGNRFTEENGVTPGQIAPRKYSRFGSRMIAVINLTVCRVVT